MEERRGWTSTLYNRDDIAGLPVSYPVPTGTTGYGPGTGIGDVGRPRHT